MWATYPRNVVAMKLSSGEGPTIPPQNERVSRTMSETSVVHLQLLKSQREKHGFLEDLASSQEHQEGRNEDTHLWWGWQIFEHMLPRVSTRTATSDRELLHWGLGQFLITWAEVSPTGPFWGSTQRREVHYPLAQDLEKVPWALDQMAIKITLLTLSPSVLWGLRSLWRWSGHLILSLLPPPQRESRLSSKSFSPDPVQRLGIKEPQLSVDPRKKKKCCWVNPATYWHWVKAIVRRGVPKITWILNQHFPLKWQTPEPAPNLEIHWFHVIRDWIEHL